MGIWVLIFLTFSHVNHEKITCDSCHNLQSPQKVLNTNKKECASCHLKNPKTYNFSLKDTNGIKFKHENHKFLSCDSCHKLEKDRFKKTKMKTCNSCHDSKKNKNKPNCVKCHTYNTKFITRYKEKTFIPVSHSNFNFKTKHLVNNENYCLQCHEKSYCLDCHKSSSKFNTASKFKVHSIDYISIHKFEKNLSTCKSCHKQEKDCKACHQKSGIDTSNLKKQNRKYKIHKDNWNHGKAAYKNISNCVSCHTQNDCITCHKKDINPHKKVKNICNRSKKEKRSCEKCHTKVEVVCP